LLRLLTECQTNKLEPKTKNAIIVLERILHSKEFDLMSKDSKKRVFSCPECGNPYEAYPPDDLHDTVSLDEPLSENAEDVTKIIHDCLQCKTPITLYWYRRKLAFSVG